MIRRDGSRPGWTQLLMNQNNEGLTSWRKAVEVGGDKARGDLRMDKRFQPLWQQPDLPSQFKDLVKSPPPSGSGAPEKPR